MVALSATEALGIPGMLWEIHPTAPLAGTLITLADDDGFLLEVYPPAGAGAKTSVERCLRNKRGLTYLTDLMQR
jgi:hypothetical protein